MSVQTDVAAMRTGLAAESNPATFLDNVLATTGRTVSADEKKVILITKTREQIMLRYATEKALS